jgi:hypothetical protein
MKGDDSQVRDKINNHIIIPVILKADDDVIDFTVDSSFEFKSTQVFVIHIPDVGSLLLRVGIKFFGKLTLLSSR